MLDYAIKELKRRKRGYLLNALVISLVTVLIITLNSLGIAYKEAARLPFEDVESTIIVQRNGNVPENISGIVLSCSLAPIRQGFIPRISEIDGVRNVSSALFLWAFDEDHFKRVLGVNWNDNFGKRLESKLIDGRVVGTDLEILIEKTYAQQYSLGVGQEVKISGRSYAVAGIVQTSGNEVVASDIYFDLREAQGMAYESVNLQETELFNRTDVNIIFVDTGQSNIRAVTQEIKRILSGGNANTGKTPLGATIGTYNISTPESFEGQVSGLFQMSAKLAWIISLVTLVGAALIIARSMLHTILERRKEFGIMKTVGFTNRDIQGQILVETSSQLLAGFLAGLVFSAIAVAALAHTTISISIPWELTAYPHFLLSDPNAANIVQTHFLPIEFEPVYALASFLVILVIGLATASLATRQVNRLRPMEVLRYE
jgi:ABC-type antimicrobial peptide transport system permease subunit